MNLLDSKANETQHPNTDEQAPTIGNASDNAEDGNNLLDNADASTEATDDASDDAGAASDSAGDDSEAITLDQKLVATFLTDDNVYMLYKGVAQAGGMLMFGIKDAEHLVEVVLAQSVHVRKVAEFMAADKSLKEIGVDKLITDALDNVSDETLKGLSGEMRFSYHDGELNFEFALAHDDLPDESTRLKRGKNGNGNGNGNGHRKAGVLRTKGVYAPLAKSHRNSDKFAYFVLKSLGINPDKCADGRSPLYRDDNLKVLVEKTEALRTEMKFEKDAPSLDGEDNKSKQMWVALLNQALAKHHGDEIKCWAE